MQARGLLGGGATLERRFAVSSNVTQGSVVCANATIGMLSAPVSNLSYSNAVGIVLDANPPIASNFTTTAYGTTQGNGANTALVYATCTYHPWEKIQGRWSNSVTAFANLAQVLGGCVMLNSSANAGGLLITDANTGTSNYIGGLCVGLTGNNAGQVRFITAHTANTSFAVTVPFDYAIAVNDTYVRIPAPLQGLKSSETGILKLTADFKDFSMVGQAANLTGTTGVTGGVAVFDVLFDAAGGAGSSVTPQRGYTVNIVNTSTPAVDIVALLAGHIFG